MTETGCPGWCPEAWEVVTVAGREMGLWQGKTLSLAAGRAGASPRLWSVCRALSSVSLGDHPTMLPPGYLLTRLSPCSTFRVSIALDAMFTSPRGTTSVNKPQYFPSQELVSKFINTGLAFSSHCVPGAGVDRFGNITDRCVLMTDCSVRKE